MKIRISRAANPANSANGCRLGRSSGLVMASPYTTLRVYRYAAAYRASFAGLRSASELAPRRPACSHAYGLDWVWAFGESFSRRQRESRPQSEPPDRGRAVGCVPGLPGKASHCEGRPWDAVPRHGEAVDQAAELGMSQEPRLCASVRGVRGVRGKEQERAPAQSPRGYSSYPCASVCIGGSKKEAPRAWLARAS